MSDFKTLNLAPELNQALEALNYSEPTPIQSQAIPIIMEGHDLMGLAQTGTGKTAAFSLPLLNHLCLDDREPPKKGTRALLLARTRELATQISEQIKSYGRKMPHLSVATVYGGVPILRHIKRLAGGADIIVATPGRLIDLLERGSVRLDGVEMLVLDEADQMMDMGFIHALKKIVPLLPKKRQTLLFSATMVPKIKRLAEQFLTEPKRVSVTPPNSTADKAEQRMTFVNKNEKLSLLALCLLKPEVTRAIVFTRTKHGADRVVKNLRQMGIDSRAIHGNKSQGQRQRALTAFRQDEIKILIATDVAARGIDIPNVSHVFNYEIPNVPEQYIHRIGRTARAEREGIAHAFVAPDERAYLKDIEKLLKGKIPKIDLPEDFVNQARALKAREALPPLEKPKPETRKGRGKNRSKSGKPKRSDKSKSDRSKSDKSNPYKGKGSDTEKPDGSNERTETKKGQPSRRDRKRSKAKTHQAGAGQGKPQHKNRNARPQGQKDGHKSGDKGRNSGGNSGGSGEREHYAKAGGQAGNKAGGYAKFKRKPKKARSDKPRSDKSRSDKPRSDKPRSDKPRGKKPAHKSGRKPAKRRF